MFVVNLASRYGRLPDRSTPNPLQILNGTGVRIQIFFIQLAVILALIQLIIERNTPTIRLACSETVDWLASSDVYKHVTTKGVVMHHVFPWGKKNPPIRQLLLELAGTTCGRFRTIWTASFLSRSRNMSSSRDRPPFQWKDKTKTVIMIESKC